MDNPICLASLSVLLTLKLLVKIGSLSRSYLGLGCPRVVPTFTDALGYGLLLLTAVGIGMALVILVQLYRQYNLERKNQLRLPIPETQTSRKTN